MSYRFLCLLFSLIVCGANAAAQYENVWAFGEKGGGLDFNGGAPVPVPTNLGVYPGTAFEAFGESSASVCDAHGRLLFYTEGFYVWDRNGNVMPNGQNLVPVFQPNLTYTPTSSTSQGTVIVPMPGDPDKYYIFSLTAKEQWQQSAGQLYYSVVDMSLNGGLGNVIVNQKGIFVDSFLSEKMTTALGNACNIWLLVCGIDAVGASNFKAYEITASGLNVTPVISSVGLGNVYTPIGSFYVSPNGKKLIATQTGAWGGLRGAALFDFDTGTGLITNPLQLLPDVGGYGACFSSDNTKVYVSTDRSTIYQFDLSFNNPNAILASKVQVGELASWSANLKMGPDGKIYFPYGNQFLGRIDFPNNPGLACTVVPEAVQVLPEQEIYVGLPNVVTVIPRDTFLTAQDIAAPCWADVNPAMLNPADYGGWDYIWQDGVTGNSRLVDTPGIYWLSYRTPPCNFHTDTFHVTFPNGVLPDIHTQSSCNAANNGKAWAETYFGDTVAYDYYWIKAGSDTLSTSDTLFNVPSGNYILHVRTHSCDTVLSFFLRDEERRVAFIADSIICQATALHFTNTSDSGFQQFRWDFGDQITSQQMHPDHIYDDAGAYQVTLVGTGTVCIDSIVKTILVDSMFRGRFVAEKDSICVGESIGFYPQADSSVLELYWSFGDDTKLATAYERRMQHAYDNFGVMPISLTMQFRACPDTSYTDSITVYPFPAVDLGGDSSICLYGQPVYLKNLGPAPLGPYRQIWSTGDTSAILKVVHPGVYSLSVTAGPIGCTTTESIEIQKDCYIDIPNAFTPNGDGNNDYFFPRQLSSKSVRRFRMQVFSRWGQLLFETTAIDGRGWDGRFNDKRQPVGVYLYRIEADFTNGRQESYEGNVTLL